MNINVEVKLILRAGSKVKVAVVGKNDSIFTFDSFNSIDDAELAQDLVQSLLETIQRRRKVVSIFEDKGEIAFSLEKPTSKCFIVATTPDAVCKIVARKNKFRNIPNVQPVALMKNA